MWREEKTRQIFHYNPPNKPDIDRTEAGSFIEKYLKDAVPLRIDAEAIRFASDIVHIDGLFIELGVCTGRTLNFIAALNPHQKIYGFDSFEGLPEDWIRGDGVVKKGTFAINHPLVTSLSLQNIEIFKGDFSDTLSSFLKERASTDPIALLHVDCDLYSSTATALELLKDRIVSGTIIIFDELYNYPGADQHEWKAFSEFLQKTGKSARYLAYNLNHEQVVVEIE